MQIKIKWGTAHYTFTRMVTIKQSVKCAKVWSTVAHPAHRQSGKVASSLWNERLELLCSSINACQWPGHSTSQALPKIQSTKVTCSKCSYHLLSSPQLTPDTAPLSTNIRVGQKCRAGSHSSTPLPHCSVDRLETRGWWQRPHTPRRLHTAWPRALKVQELVELWEEPQKGLPLGSRAREKTGTNRILKGKLLSDGILCPDRDRPLSKLCTRYGGVTCNPSTLEGRGKRITSSKPARAN